MSIKDDIVFDSNGFVPPADITQPVSDNGVLFTSQYYILLKEHGLLTPDDVSAFIHKMRFVNIDGNLKRYPSDTGKEGPDDYIGLCSASKALGTIDAHLIYEYGRKTFWNYNNENPDEVTLESWLGRQPGLIGYIKYCAGHLMNPLEFLAIYVGTIITAFGKKEDTSDKLLALTMVSQLKNNLLFKPLCSFYLWKIRRTYGSINELVRVYFGLNHPFSKWWA